MLLIGEKKARLHGKSEIIVKFKNLSHCNDHISDSH